MQLVRAALLYADAVELMSPTARMLAAVSGLASGTPESIVEFLESLDDSTAIEITGEVDVSTALEGMRGLAQLNALPRAERRKYLSKDDEARLTVLRAEVAETFAGVDEFVKASGMPELVDAIDSRVLTLDLDDFNGDTDDYMDRFAERVRRRLETTGVHLLLDEQMAGIARGMIDEGLAVPSQTALSRAVRSHVGTRLISHLPAFPDARVVDILEARAELLEPLTAYRSGMKSVERSLKAQAFDQELSSEIDELWHDEVDPAIRRLRADLSGTRIAHAAGLNIAEHAKWPAVASTVSFGVGHAAQWTAAGAATALTAVAGTVISGSVKAYKETQATRDAAQSHGMFYLLQLQDRLVR